MLDPPFVLRAGAIFAFSQQCYIAFNLGYCLESGSLNEETGSKTSNLHSL